VKPMIRLMQFLSAVLFLTFIVPAHAADKQPQWAGVWSGTIGNVQVRVCLTERAYWNQPFKGSGAYFYMKYLKTLHLEQEGPKTWVETTGGVVQVSDPRWNIDRVLSNSLSGRWTAAGKTLPLRLKRLSAEADCGSQTFNQPRFKPFVVSKQNAELDGRKYVKLVSSAGEHLDLSFESFQLVEAGAVIAKVNEALREKIPVGNQQADFFECLIGALSATTYDGSYGETLEPVMLTRDWLSFSHSSGGYCGGAHPFGSSSMLTFDLRTGDKIDLQNWLNLKALDPKGDPAQGYWGEDASLSDALRKFLVEYKPAEDEQDAECKVAARESNYWDIGLERNGMSFTPGMPHVMTACANPILVPYTKLSPYLNKTGEIGVASVMANLRDTFR
jgi:hypothetical protein